MTTPTPTFTATTILGGFPTGAELVSFLQAVPAAARITLVHKGERGDAVLHVTASWTAEDQPRPTALPLTHTNIPGARR